MDEEEAKDNEYRSQFRDRWTCTPSRELTTNLRATSNKYMDKLRIARNSDELVRQKIEENLPHIESLSATKVKSLRNPCFFIFF